MSLRVDDNRRGRSRSPGGRERDRSRSRGPPLVVDADPYAERGDHYDDHDRRTADYEYDDRGLSYRPPLSPRGLLSSSNDQYRPRSPAVENGARVSYGDNSRREKEYRHEERTSDRDRDNDKGATFMDAYLPQKYAKKLENSSAFQFMTTPSNDRERESLRDKRERKKEKLEEDLAYGKLHSLPIKNARPLSPRPISPRPASPSYSYTEPQQWQYAQPEERDHYSRPDSKYGSNGLDARGYGSSTRTPSSGPGHGREDRDREDRGKKYYRDSLTADPNGSSGNVVTVKPGAVPRQSAMKRPSSPQPPVARMSSLSVGGAQHPSNLSVRDAPGSPLLESYHGTWQSISPMPSPMLLPTRGPDAHVMDISPIGSDDERGGKKRSRRARFYDPEEDASVLADALRGNKPPKTSPLITILPGLTHDQVMELRTEYKRLVKTGTEKKGVNVAKHIRARLKDEDSNLMKACYTTALGKWESEAYWANYWYQGDKTRRELLIESLMGRTNDEIRHIKAGFSDRKYDHSLTKCMKQELKEDKFKKAVLMVLDEQRMDDLDGYGRPMRIDRDLVGDDVHALHKAVKAEKGGESAMLQIVVMRSDDHLREVLSLYSAEYRSNFARDALKKSGNLVGELLAHILNGVINKPVRDALLIHHALTASKKDGLRRELLISRLVRYHWDVHHMQAVKKAYRERYGKDLQEAVKDGSRGEWGAFCGELCITRMPDDVRNVDKVNIHR